MRLKQMFVWFCSTLLLGTALAVIIGELVHLITGKPVLGELGSLLLSGSATAAVTLLGFFSYLLFNLLFNGLVRNRKVYEGFQIILILIMIGNLVYMNMAKFSGESLGVHLLIPVLIVVVAAGTAWLKAKWTQASGFIPTLFFMIVATSLESISALNPPEGEVGIPLILYVVVVLLVCNAWQILRLHHWVREGEISRKKSQTKVSSS